MKKLLYLGVCIFCILFSCSSEETTTYYLIRHAEKDRSDKTNKNPNLNENGLKRAENWANYFKNIHLDAVYSTNYNRTEQTAKPTAISKNLTILNYNASEMYDSIFQNKTIGKSVLIVGHSNTTPVFANKILDKKVYDFMDDNDNASLYIITITKNKKTSRVEKIN